MKKMVKKTLGMFVLGLMVFSLTACGGKDDKTKDDKTDSNYVAEENEKSEDKDKKEDKPSYVLTNKSLSNEEKYDILAKPKKLEAGFDEEDLIGTVFEGQKLDQLNDITEDEIIKIVSTEVTEEEKELATEFSDYRIENRERIAKSYEEIIDENGSIDTEKAEEIDDGILKEFAEKKDKSFEDLKDIVERTSYVAGREYIAASLTMDYLDSEDHAEEIPSENEPADENSDTEKNIKND